MDNIIDLVNRNLPNKGTGGSPPEGEKEPSWTRIVQARKAAIDRIFMRMSVLYPNRWASQFPDPAAFRLAQEEWMQGLADLGLSKRLTEACVDRALEGCRQRVNKHGEAWPPNLAEFLALCYPRPEDVGAPCPDDAFRAAYYGYWGKHPIVWRTVQALYARGVDVVKGEEAKTKSLFLRVYRQFLERAYAGEQFEIPETEARQLGHDKPKKITAPGEARQHVAAMRQALGKHNRNDQDEGVP